MENEKLDNRGRRWKIFGKVKRGKRWIEWGLGLEWDDGERNLIKFSLNEMFSK